MIFSKAMSRPQQIEDLGRVCVLETLTYLLIVFQETYIQSQWHLVIVHPHLTFGCAGCGTAGTQALTMFVVERIIGKGIAA
jgi:hypothetical protein